MTLVLDILNLRNLIAFKWRNLVASWKWGSEVQEICQDCKYKFGSHQHISPESVPVKMVSSALFPSSPLLYLHVKL